MQLLVHGGAHLFEFFLVVGLQLAQTQLDRAAHLRQILVGRLTQFGKPRLKGLSHGGLALFTALARLDQALVGGAAQGFEALDELGLQRLQALGVGLGEVADLLHQGVAHRLLQALELQRNGVELGVLRARALALLVEQHLLELRELPGLLGAQALAAGLHRAAQFALQAFELRRHFGADLAAKLGQAAQSRQQHPAESEHHEQQQRHEQ